MLPATFDSWNKGIIDNYIDAGPGYSERLHNFFLQRNGKPKQRPALKLYGDRQLPGGSVSIDSIYFFDHTMFAKCGTKLYYNDELNGSGWVALGGPSSHDAFPDSETGAGASWSEWRGHVFITPHVTANLRGGCRTMKVYRNSSNAWTLFQAGLPRGDDATLNGTDEGMVESPGQIQYNFNWYAMFYNTYTAKVNGIDVTFEELGSPRVITDQGDAIGYDGGLFGPQEPTRKGMTYVNSASENYPTATMLARLYRTKGNGTIPYLVDENALATQFTDDITDSLLGAEAYVGIQDGNYNDPPPKAFFHLSTDGNLWFFGGVDQDSGALYPNRVWQGKPSGVAMTGIPSGNFTDCEGETGTAFDRAGSIPVAFFHDRCFRIEGRLDAQGGGSLRSVIISSIYGAASPCTVRNGRGIYFMSHDGWCFTDGYTVTNLSEHLTETYARLLNKHKAVAGYDTFNKRVFFGVETEDFQESSDYNNAAFVLEERFIHQSDYGMTGSFASMDAVSTFKPSAMYYDQKNKRMLIGDAFGFIYELDEDVVYDTLPVITGLSVSTKTAPIVWDWISWSTSFGDPVNQKWVSDLNSTWENSTGKLSVDLFSHNDDKATTKQFGPVRERIALTAGVHRIQRLFPKGHLACTYKQLQAKKGLVNLFRSDDYAVAHVHRESGTVEIMTNYWPRAADQTDLVGHTIYFENDNYDQGFEITAQSGAILTLDNSAALLVEADEVKWVVKGYPKDEGGKPHSFSMGFELIQDAESRVGMGGAGANE